MPEDDGRLGALTSQHADQQAWTTEAENDPLNANDRGGRAEWPSFGLQSSQIGDKVLHLLRRTLLHGADFLSK